MSARILLLVLASALLAPPGAAPGPGAPQASATHHVHMLAVAGSAFQYDPPLLQVAVGDTVSFHSHDILHSATSGATLESEPVEGAVPAALHLNAFDTGPTPGQTSRSVVVGSAGAFAYYCTVGFHRLFGMHGLVVAS